MNINLDAIWNTVQAALPELLEQWPTVYQTADNQCGNSPL
jgi:uncharacterized protein with HEPN domain